MTADEFPRQRLGEREDEAPNRVIRMMAGGTARHARMQADILVALADRCEAAATLPVTGGGNAL